METSHQKSEIDRQLDELRQKKAGQRSRNGWWAFALVSSLVMNAVISFFLFYPVTPLEYSNEPLPVTTPVVHPGDRVGYLAKYCKYIDASSSIIRRLVYSDGRTISGNPVIANTPTGCATSTVLSYSLPSNAPEGVAHLEISSDYQVNPFRHVTVHAITQDFTILPTQPPVPVTN